MEFKEGTPLYAHEVQREGSEDVLYVNYLGASYVPSLVEQPEVMARTIDALVEAHNATRIVFVQQRNYNYDFNETQMLLEIAQLYTYLLHHEKILSPQKLSLISVQTVGESSIVGQRHSMLYYFLQMLRQDPLYAHAELKRFIVETKVVLDRAYPAEKPDVQHFLDLLAKIERHLESTRLLRAAAPHLAEYQKGDRQFYYKLFRADIIPNFTFTRLVADLPDDADIIDQYEIASPLDEDDTSLITILKKDNEAKYLYHVTPPEGTLVEEQITLLNLARGVLIEHQPQAEEFTDTARTRQVFFNIARDLLRDLATAKQISLSYSDLQKLARVLVRHTVGFGLIEVLLQDKYLQDIVLNAPIPRTPIFLRHSKYGECYVNIIPSQEDVDSWAAKFRMISGRPLDEANPILDTQLDFGEMSARIAIIQRPLSPDGLAYAIRRHRETPWTLPLFVQNGMLNSFTAGLLSFMIDGSRTLLVAGTRSSGKTSLLGSLLLEIIPRYRIIVLEDTLELPVEALRKLQYDILRMKVRSSLLQSTTEVGADEGIRTSLRLGDSSLIVGEVRSVEARALYEAMRVGALANVVAGTIHGASPYAIFDRVVNDLGVPATSFKATDLILVANPIKSADGLHTKKRMIQLSEVRKHWKEDPGAEGGFVDLVKYNIEKDTLEPTEDLINGDSEVIKAIAGNVKGWAGNWDAVYDNILLRGNIKQEIVNVSEKLQKPHLLEAPFTSLSNTIFHQISEEVGSEIGIPTSERVFPAWQQWLNKAVKGKSI